jgi:hypothetical protein
MSYHCRKPLVLPRKQTEVRTIGKQIPEPPLPKPLTPSTYPTLTGFENALKDVERQSLCGQQLKD